MAIEKEDNCYLEGVTTVTPKTILTFAWHIAKGMAYLTDMKVGLKRISAGEEKQKFAHKKLNSLLKCLCFSWFTETSQHGMFS